MILLLVFKEVKELYEYKLNIDYYIPISIKFNDANSVFYWRVGNFKNSLLEIGVNNKTGELISIDLVCANNIKLTNNSFYVNTKSIVGIPIFKLINNIDNNLYDVNEEIYIFLNVNYIKINIGELKNESKIICLGRIYFIFDNNDILYSILIVDLSIDEYYNLKESFHL